MPSRSLTDVLLRRLAEIADSLGWDLEQKVFPIVRWLVYHKKATVVDMVHESLRTTLVLSDKFDHSYVLTFFEEMIFKQYLFVQQTPRIYNGIFN